MSRVSPKDIHPVLRDEERPAAAWIRHADQLLDKGLLGPALLAEVRAAGNGAPPERLHTLLRDRVAERAPRATEEALAAVAKASRFADADADKMIARLVDGIVDGGDAAPLLAQAARILQGEGNAVAALDLARGALGLEGGDPALVVFCLADLGRFEEARAAIAQVEARDPKRASLLRTYVGALTHPFDFRAGSYLAGEPDDDVELSPLSLEDAQAGIRSIVRRASTIRAALVEIAGDAAWLPDLTPLVDGGAKMLADDYDLEAEVPENLPALILELRKEWSRLSWALAALGATGLAMPSAIVKPRCSMGFVDAFTAQRHDLLCDLAEGKTPMPADDLDRELLASTWGETRLADLDPALAQIWLDETEAALAGLRWAMGTAPTPWSAQ